MPLGVASAPVAKRPRSEAHEAPASTSVTQSKKIWFDDGNIVLQVESTQFRLHRSVLTIHSTVFGSMFALAQPGSEAHVDGCPIVHLYGDTPEEWETALSFLYRITTLDPESPCPLALSAMARLGKTYDISPLFLEACRLLKAQFPYSLASFDDLFNRRSFDNSARWILDNITTIFLLSDETGVQSILPVAYYIALIYKKDIFYETPFTPKHLTAILYGQGHIPRAAIACNFSWVYDGCIPDDNCLDIKSCKKVLGELLKDILQKSTDVDIALASWDEAARDQLLAHGFCNPCRTVAKNTFEEGRQYIWKKLPSYFLRMTWADLLDLDKKALNTR